ncbi:Asp23/Gls24 family envelope stress response protein [Streptomyces sp. AN091965]|uniref:Asp23/Gls24 family envelope stress response protein n=1 Tax=Streptomyces sp. AN091965 TaxID=2927803 RepID=UPI001F604D31|nr:Asp23/Gls24 family envelope stress response protein [Streptomyces sp. AN091965]MCI3935467.1 Asp23/Gls24 family envelope stress response protein [Streptomyces sp. AN091965]
MAVNEHGGPGAGEGTPVPYEGDGLGPSYDRGGPLPSYDGARDDDEAPEDERLPCGRRLAAVWEAGEAGEPDPHIADCPYCLPALDGFYELQHVVWRARDAQRSAWPADASALSARIMDVVRLELRPGRTLPLGEADEDAWIVEAAAARTFRAAAETLPGVRAGSCRVTPAGPGGAARAPVTVRVEVQVAPSWDLPDVADRVRHRIADAAADALGLRVAAVDVVITDLLDGNGDGTW